jgi:hypothetical protein
LQNFKVKNIFAGGNSTMAIDFNGEVWVNLKTLSYSFGHLVIMKLGN